MLSCLAVSTVYRRLRQITSLLQWLDDNHIDVNSFSDISREEMEEYLIELKVNFPVSTTISQIEYLRGFFLYASDVLDDVRLETLVQVNDIPRKILPKYETYTSEEKDRIIKAAIEMEDKQVARALMVCIYTGMRIGDLLQIDNNCLSEEDGTPILSFVQKKTIEAYLYQYHLR